MDKVGLEPTDLGLDWDKQQGEDAEEVLDGTSPMHHHQELPL